MWPFKRSKKDKKKYTNSIVPLLFVSRWEEIAHCRADQNLQNLHSIEDAKQKYLSACSPCPVCGKSAVQLSWLYYLDPENRWPMQGGWMTVCDQDEVEVDFFVEQQEFYSWEIVETERNNTINQTQLKSESETLRGSMSCPKCKRTPQQLSWFWFHSPQKDWEALAGRAGWMSICDVCHIQVEFLPALMS